jgi:hypothetical protein
MRDSRIPTLRKNLVVYKLIACIPLLILTVFLWGCDPRQEEQSKMSIEDLNVQANLVFLYYKDLASAQDFYENTLGLEMVLDYGFAKLFRISLTTYVGLVNDFSIFHKTQGF